MINGPNPRGANLVFSMLDSGNVCMGAQTHASAKGSKVTAPSPHGRRGRGALAAEPQRPTDVAWVKRTASRTPVVRERDGKEQAGRDPAVRRRNAYRRAIR